MNYLKQIAYFLVLLCLFGGIWLASHHVTYPVLPASKHYNPHQQQFFNTPESQPVKGGLKTILTWLYETISPPENRFPQHKLPEIKPDWQKFLNQNHQFIWFGHSTLMMRLNGQTFLIDPVFSESASPVPFFAKRFQAPPATLAELPKIDWIVISHNHYDHLDKDTIKFFVHQKHTQFIVPLNLGALLKKWGIESERIQELDWWQNIDLNGLKVYSVPTRHDSVRGLNDKNKTLWSGWLFKDNIKKIYYTGDSSYGDGSHFQAIGKRFGGVDLAFVENGQYNENWADNHMFPAQSVQAGLDVGAKKIVPVHWGMFALSRHDWRASVRESVPLMRQKGIEPITPKLGQVFDMETKTDEWWEFHQNF